MAPARPSDPRPHELRRHALAHVALTLVLAGITAIVALVPGRVAALVTAQPHGPVGRLGWLITVGTALLTLATGIGASRSWRRARDAGHGPDSDHGT